MVNMSAKFNEEAHNGVASIVFTRSTQGRTDVHTHVHTYGTSAVLLYPLYNALFWDKTVT